MPPWWKTVGVALWRTLLLLSLGFALGQLLFHP
jgi:hypothetical protein